MEPVSWGTVIGGVLTILVAVIGFFQHKRMRRDNLAQAEVDELQRGLDQSRTPDPTRPDKLFVDKPGDNAPVLRDPGAL